VILSSRHEPSRLEAGPASVLVMEDESDVAKAIEMILGEEGYEVETAMNGQSALEQLHSKNFDLLLADLRLPDMNGIEVIRKVRSDWPGTAVLVITGYPAMAPAYKVMELGALDYLLKPFTDEELTGAVASALKTGGKLRSDDAPFG
jgi:DNA-binding NtrC family response regulator